MIQNSHNSYFAKFLSLPAAVAVFVCACPSFATAQIVNSDAFSGSEDHSILVRDDDQTEDSARISQSFVNPNTEAPLTSGQSEPLGFAPAPQTSVSPANAAFDAPLAPQPKLYGARPQSNIDVQDGSSTSGTFASPRDTIGAPRVSKLQPVQDVNSLRSAGLSPAPENQPPVTEQPAQFEQPAQLSTGSFSSSTSSVSTPFLSSKNSTTIVTESAGTNSTASIHDTTEDSSEPKFESAYLHDQESQRSTPATDSFGSPSNARRLTPPTQLSTAAAVDEKSTVQQTAFLSPAAPAQPLQFQNNQNSRWSPQQQSGQQNQFGQQSGRGQQPGRGQQTRQQNLPRQAAQSGNASSSDSSKAKQVISKFAFETNQQLANGLPIRLIDLMQQGFADRSQLIPQYWEVYYDWAQSISAFNHRNWVSSINSPNQNDASSLEVAKSNAENAITFSAIQLGKSQAKMKSLTGGAQPIIPIDSPTVTRVKTNYEAFKNRGMIPPRFEGIDATLQQMHQLIVSRANTVAMAEQNANQAKQQYSGNQSTIHNVLNAGRTWRSAEADFIASVIEYNKAYADYALALPYGRGPAETVVKMLIVKPTSSQSSGGGQLASGRPNLSNDARISNNDQNQNEGSDYSVPYGGGGSGNSAIAAQRGNRGNAGNRGGNNVRPASNPNRSQAASTSFGGQSNPSRSQAAAASFGGQSSTAGNVRQNTRPQPTSRPQPTAGFSAAANPNPATGSQTATGTNLIKRPSQFPTAQQSHSVTQPAGSGSRTTQSVSQPTQPAASQFTLPGGQKTNSSQPKRRGFGRPKPTNFPPAGDKTAGASDPFGAIRSADSSTSVPVNSPKPPASTGFNFGG